MLFRPKNRLFPKKWFQWCDTSGGFNQAGWFWSNRCKGVGEWTPVGAFSEQQQKKFIQFQDRRQRINTANSGITCKEHTSCQRTEMTSEMCGLIKSLNDFSKNARKSEDPVGLLSSPYCLQSTLLIILKHCKRCTAWIETQEPEIVSVLLETGHILVEEERGEIWPITFISDADFATASRAERV